MRATCSNCDRGKHSECNGTAVYIEQDGANRYVCECFCRSRTLRDVQHSARMAEVRSLMIKLGVNTTHELIEKRR
jgi:hypothetical protein